MSERPMERCFACDSFTGRAGMGDGSIYWLDGAIGPLCEECNDSLRTEVMEDIGDTEPYPHWDTMTATEKTEAIRKAR